MKYRDINTPNLFTLSLISSLRRLTLHTVCQSDGVKELGIWGSLASAVGIAYLHTTPQNCPRLPVSVPLWPLGHLTARAQGEGHQSRLQVEDS